LNLHFSINTGLNSKNTSASGTCSLAVGQKTKLGLRCTCQCSIARTHTSDPSNDIQPLSQSRSQLAISLGCLSLHTGSGKKTTNPDGIGCHGFMLLFNSYISCLPGLGEDVKEACLHELIHVTYVQLPP